MGLLLWGLLFFQSHGICVRGHAASARPAFWADRVAPARSRPDYGSTPNCKSGHLSTWRNSEIKILNREKVKTCRSVGVVLSYRSRISTINMNKHGIKLCGITPAAKKRTTKKVHSCRLTACLEDPNASNVKIKIQFLEKLLISLSIFAKIRISSEKWWYTLSAWYPSIWLIATGAVHTDRHRSYLIDLRKPHTCQPQGAICPTRWRRPHSPTGCRYI